MFIFFFSLFSSLFEFILSIFISSILSWFNSLYWYKLFSFLYLPNNILLLFISIDLNNSILYLFSFSSNNFISFSFWIKVWLSVEVKYFFFIFSISFNIGSILLLYDSIIFISKLLWSFIYLLILFSLFLFIKLFVKFILLLL